MTGPRSKPGKSSSRHGMAEGSVWFRAAIGRQKKAEARWLLPMICRRGGIDKHDIGAIRILETTTEFEISKQVAESFAVKIRRPDKEDNIRIEMLAEAPQAQPPQARDERGPKPHGKVVSENGAGFAQESDFKQADFKQASFKKKKRHLDKPAHAGPPQRAGAPPAKAAFGKKAKKYRRG
jgi:ATP-dependent RNA helicase DeaD